MEKLDQPEIAVDRIIEKLGNNIILGIPLAAGKPNHLVNAIYQRAKNNKKISLTICTALTLERPKPKSDLEKRFIASFEERVFADYPDLDYELDRTTNQLPENIEIVEFYFPPGKYLDNPQAQQNYVSSNYTHVCRDMIDRGINLIAQMVSARDDKISLSCNADVTLDMLPLMRQKDYPVMIVAQINQNLPFMYGDAEVSEDIFDLIIDRPADYYKIFGPPKMSVSDVDYMIGLYTSALVKDDGELQVGIGALGDAVIYGLILREKDNGIYRKVLKDTGLLDRFGSIIDNIGSLDTFKTGLFGATEMMVDGFMELYENGILKKKVYDNIDLQRLINENLLDPQKLTDNIFDLLIGRNIIQRKLTESDFKFLTFWGIFKPGLTFKQGVIYLDDSRFINPDLDEHHNKTQIIQQCLGEKLRHGHLMHAAFFLGPTKFYQWLKSLPVVERKRFQMKSVLKINQLYGHEIIDRLHRKNARFVNTCMMTTLSGAHVSDGLESGKVVSGVGGQYNFVSMAQELPDGHSIITMRATRTQKGKLSSNIVFNYGHVTVPRHMRDILVTEYGIAFLRGKTDQEIIIELLKVADSRFQNELMEQAVQAGKLSTDYKLPDEFKNNLPENHEKVLNEHKKNGIFPKFPFGTDLTEEEIIIGGALKRLKSQMESGPVNILKLMLQAILTSPQPSQLELLNCMGLAQTKTIKERLYQKLICTQLVE